MNKKEWKAIWRLLCDYSKGRSSVIISMILHGIIPGARPFISVVLTGKLIDAVYNGADFEIIAKYSLIAVSVYGILSVIDGIAVKIYNQSMEYMFEIQNGPINKKSMAMDYEYLEDAKVHDGRQKLSLNNSRFGVIGAALSHLEQLLLSVTSCICAFVIVLPMFFKRGEVGSGFITSPVASVLFVIIVGVLIWANYKVLTYYNAKHLEIQRAAAPFSNRRRFYLDLLGVTDQQKDIRIYDQRELLFEEMEQVIHAEKEVGKKCTSCMVKNGVIAQIVVALLSIVVYTFSGLRCYAGMITIGNVVTYAASISKVSEAVRLFVQRLGWLKYAANNAENYIQFMDLSQRKHEGTIPMEKRRDNKFSVEFENVSFKYPGSDTYVIKNLNLSFVIGEKMAIVGKNGSGKTTFIKLLCRLYDVTEGCIKVNGIDIRKYDYQEYCYLFAVVFQDFCMFDFPVGENLACSTDVDEKKAMDALNRAGLGERMKELPEGLKTYVGKGFDENGVNFSGGEKQKMAIARAIYKDAPFVIMDEPTAALDPEAECEVFEGFDKMVGKKTAIYISHRLASCRFCEDILVFDKGRVVQRGTHEELEKQDGLYKELWNAQAVYYA
ncbi:MAG: ABC transporter ATP-binding protein [Lachnospiraceae bacterium]|nr:ABC transporter ATP-binding protein [Lachnospiraceae bacterium]